MAARRVWTPMSTPMRATALVVGLAFAVTVVGCGRSSSKGGGGGASASTSTSAKPSASATAAAGDFGSLKGICGPGKATGATGRGVTGTSIRIGTSGDPGAAAAPGLEEEFFQVGDAFVKWCNAAGGINGRKLQLDKWDAKLFNVGQAFTSACQVDFMMVGNGNAFDSAAVKPRLACNLGQIPAYVVAPEAANAGLQVLPSPQKATQYQAAALRLLNIAYPDTKTKGVGIGGSNLSSLIPQGLRIKQSLEQYGIKVTTVQEQPPLVDNYRPYMEEMKSKGTVGIDQFNGQDATAEVQAMKNVGWNPEWFLLSVPFYNPSTVKSAATVAYPPSYVQLTHLPFELANQFPVLAEAKKILTDSIPNPRFTDFTALAFNAWTLWAKSATACGSTLTVSCVLAKAGAETAWTGGGLFPPSNLDPKNVQVNPCVTIIRLTTSGWVYDKKVTNPDNGVYNCDPSNVQTVKSFQ
jgi:ABC-type branched-subunit amino acid transport system substrate-binding protein